MRESLVDGVVQSDEILNLRDRIGLPPDAHHKWVRFHLTFGKEWE